MMLVLYTFRILLILLLICALIPSELDSGSYGKVTCDWDFGNLSTFSVQMVTLFFSERVRVPPAASVIPVS